MDYLFLLFNSTAQFQSGLLRKYF